MSVLSFLEEISTKINNFVLVVCSKVRKSLPIGIGKAGTFAQDRIKQIPDNQLTATSYTSYQAKYGRLGNKKVWCASSNQLRYQVMLIFWLVLIIARRAEPYGHSHGGSG